MEYEYLKPKKNIDIALALHHLLLAIGQNRDDNAFKLSTSSDPQKLEICYFHNFLHQLQLCK